ncbi:hypothetical protein [Catellatospora sp. TT07R-123]|uniref:hypothetical protein n=1 Tax=Catellatospora sp. TT07R-123 TaxID=2733863 RepID=UPI001BB433C7|nr:hypothetical protein [Catellatospora sp. TT07R-123]
MAMTPRSRAVLRVLALAMLASLVVAFGFGRPGDDDLGAWWDSGARLSADALAAHLGDFFGDDAVSGLFARLAGLLARPGLALWNAVTASELGRWLVLGVAGAVAVDAVRNGLGFLLRKPAPQDPPTT